MFLTSRYIMYHICQLGNPTRREVSIEGKSTEGGKHRGRQVKCGGQAPSGLDAIIQTQEAREETRCEAHKHILCATGKHRYFQIKTQTHKKRHTYTKNLPLSSHGLNRC